MVLTLGWLWFCSKALSIFSSCFGLDKEANCPLSDSLWVSSFLLPSWPFHRRVQGWDSLGGGHSPCICVSYIMFPHHCFPTYIRFPKIHVTVWLATNWPVVFSVPDHEFYYFATFLYLNVNVWEEIKGLCWAQIRLYPAVSHHAQLVHAFVPLSQTHWAFITIPLKIQAVVSSRPAIPFSHEHNEGNSQSWLRFVA